MDMIESHLKMAMQNRGLQIAVFFPRFLSAPDDDLQ
jgi:hypothetical protein